MPREQITTHVFDYCIACNSKQVRYWHTLGKAKYGLCEACWRKVVRGGRTPQQTIEAVLLCYHETEFGGPQSDADHEDYRDVKLLGLWE